MWSYLISFFYFKLSGNLRNIIIVGNNNNTIKCTTNFKQIRDIII